MKLEKIEKEIKRLESRSKRLYKRWEELKGEYNEMRKKWQKERLRLLKEELRRNWIGKVLGVKWSNFRKETRKVELGIPRETRMAVIDIADGQEYSYPIAWLFEVAEFKKIGEDSPLEEAMQESWKERLRIEKERVALVSKIQELKAKAEVMRAGEGCRVKWAVISLGGFGVRLNGKTGILKKIKESRCIVDFDGVGLVDVPMTHIAPIESGRVEWLKKIDAEKFSSDLGRLLSQTLGGE